MNAKYGSIFEKITGVSIDTCKSTIDVNQVLESHFGRPLEVIYANSRMVPCAEVIPLCHIDRNNIDNEIDRILKSF